MREIRKQISKLSETTRALIIVMTFLIIANVFLGIVLVIQQCAQNASGRQTFGYCKNSCRHDRWRRV